MQELEHQKRLLKALPTSTPFSAVCSQRNLTSVLNTHILTLQCSYMTHNQNLAADNTCSCGDRRETQYQLIQDDLDNEVVVHTSLDYLSVIFTACLKFHRVHLRHVHRGRAGGNLLT